jgi:hypothetical protein
MTVMITVSYLDDGGIQFIWNIYIYLPNCILVWHLYCLAVTFLAMWVMGGCWENALSVVHNVHSVQLSECKSHKALVQNQTEIKFFILGQLWTYLDFRQIYSYFTFEE